MRKVISTLCLALTLGGVAAAESADVSKLDGRIAAAHAVLHALMATPDKGVPL